MKIKTMKNIAEYVENEGLDYFLTSYASPDIISDTAEPDALKFKQIWQEVLPLLSQLEELLEKSNERKAIHSNSK